VFEVFLSPVDMAALVGTLNSAERRALEDAAVAVATAVLVACVAALAMLPETWAVVG
jgi:hypothetical protein